MTEIFNHLHTQVFFFQANELKQYKVIIIIIIKMKSHITDHEKQQEGKIRES